MKKLCYLLLFFFLLLSSLLGQSELRTTHNVTLAWDPNPATESTGFIVYWGLASGSYAWSTNVGYATTRVIPGLLEEVTYYFAVTSYDSEDVESDFSNEISYTPSGTDPVDTTPEITIKPVKGKAKRVNVGKINGP